MQSSSNGGTSTAQLVAVWLLVGIPLAWGIVQTLSSALQLFR